MNWVDGIVSTSLQVILPVVKNSRIVIISMEFTNLTNSNKTLNLFMNVNSHDRHIVPLDKVIAKGERLELFFPRLLAHPQLIRAQASAPGIEYIIQYRLTTSRD